MTINGENNFPLCNTKILGSVSINSQCNLDCKFIKQNSISS